MYFSESSHVEPNAVFLSVIFSLVCESNVGFSINVFAKIHRCGFTWNGLILNPPFPVFLLTVAISFSHI